MEENINNMRNLNRLLIIEDSEIWQKTFQFHLNDLAQVFSALTEAEARTKLALKDKPTAAEIENQIVPTHVMIDGNLDRIINKGRPDTVELAKEIRKKFPDIIMLGISSEEDHNQGLIKAGCNDAVFKEDALGRILELLNYE